MRKHVISGLLALLFLTDFTIIKCFFTSRLLVLIIVYHFRQSVFIN